MSQIEEIKLQTYTLLTDTDLKNQITKQQVIYRLENWLEGYVEKFIENDGYNPKLCHRQNNLADFAYESAKYELQDFNSFQKINEESELIDVDPLDEPEEFKFQMEVLKEWAKNL